MNIKAGSWRIGVEYTALPVQFASAHLQQDAKYVGYNGLIYNRATGLPIPPWEPTFLFRAKDDLAADALLSYLRALEQRREELRSKYGPAHPQVLAASQHVWVVGKRVAEFMLYRSDNASEMQPADTAVKDGQYAAPLALAAYA
jgi:hypothetical protein